VYPFGSQANANLLDHRPLALRPNLAIGLPFSRMMTQQARSARPSFPWTSMNKPNGSGEEKFAGGAR
jgi:hypothetical protein